MSCGGLYGTVSLDEIHRNGSVTNQAYMISSADSFDEVADVGALALVESPTAMSERKQKLGLSSVHKLILAILILAVFGLVGVSTATLILLLRQNEDIRRIKEDLWKMDQDEVVLFPEYTNRQFLVDSKKGSTNNAPVIVQPEPGLYVEEINVQGRPGSTKPPSTRSTTVSPTTVDNNIVTGWYRACNGLSYKFFEEKSPYKIAKSTCSVYGARLASTGLRNETIRNELYSLSPTQQFWIGLDELENNGHWIWSDGIESPESDLPWDVGQPNSAGTAKFKQECVEMGFSGKFNDEYCIIPQKFLCEKG